MPETPAKDQRIGDALERINKLNKKRTDLLEELSMSLKVKRIWPAAFENGQRCRLRAVATARNWELARKAKTNPHIKPPIVTGAYLERDDGEIYRLTSDQFYSLAKL